MEDEDMPVTPIPTLRVFANLVERHDLEIGLTLLVSGQWVSGLLTSRRRYLDALSRSLEEGTRDESGKKFAAAFARVVEDELVPELVEIPPEEREMGPEVFLREARLWAGGETFDRRVLAVRTDRVDAVWVGNPFAIPQD